MTTKTNTDINIKNFTAPELEEIFVQIGQPKFRAKQVLHEAFAQRKSSFHDMSNLPLALRLELEEKYQLSSIKSSSWQNSSDGTIKFLFELHDGRFVETVLIPGDEEGDNGFSKRYTLCVSSQVGCALNCAFCATGKLKFGRNLEASEIVDQFIEAERLSGYDITNIVFMGMGEPMLNYDNVVKAIRILSNPDYNLLSHKRITVSTSGIVPGIYKLAEEKVQVKLALSLHATTDDLRRKLMPIAKKWSLKDLGDALEFYYRKTKIPLTYEYIVFDEINTTQDDVKRLSKIAGRVPSKVNLIPFHDISFTGLDGFAAELKTAPFPKIVDFKERLRRAGVLTFLRTSSGKDIDAACGQLAYSKRESSEI